MKRYDIAIIGTGPAGLEAAITAKLRNKDILLLGKEPSSDKVAKAHLVQNYLGLPNASGKELSAAYSRHLSEMEIGITPDRANAVYAMGEYFAIQGHAGEYEAQTLILAAGMSADKALPGETENLGMGVSYCATCDAALYKGRTAVILAYSQEDEAEAEFLAERAQKVWYLPRYKALPEFRAENIEVLSGMEPVKISREDARMELECAGENGEKSAFRADGIFILRQQVAPAQLVPGLKMDGSHVETDRQMRTNIPGLFACGDITGTPYQYIKAAGEGNVAALSAVRYLSEK